MNQVDLRCVAVDGLVYRDSEILLIKRRHEPYKGHWVLPGGMVEKNETTHQACTREVLEETGIQPEIESLIGIYDDPDRDERGNISICYAATPIQNRDPSPGEEATHAEYHGLKSLPQLGFDHLDMIKDALDQGLL